MTRFTTGSSPGGTAAATKTEAKRGEGAGSGVAERESVWQGVLTVIIETSKMVPDVPPIVVTVTRVPVYV
jgi:hypothetical protein